MYYRAAASGFSSLALVPECSASPNPAGVGWTSLNTTGISLYTSGDSVPLNANGVFSTDLGDSVAWYLRWKIVGDFVSSSDTFELNLATWVDVLE